MKKSGNKRVSAPKKSTKNKKTQWSRLNEPLHCTITNPDGKKLVF